jgi:hypothetical protein
MPGARAASRRDELRERVNRCGRRALVPRKQGFYLIATPLTVQARFMEVLASVGQEPGESPDLIE